MAKVAIPAPMYPKACLVVKVVADVLFVFFMVNPFIVSNYSDQL